MICLGTGLSRHFVIPSGPKLLKVNTNANLFWIAAPACPDLGHDTKSRGCDIKAHPKQAEL
jgi:hypothetical protein